MVLLVTVFLRKSTLKVVTSSRARRVGVYLAAEVISYTSLRMS